MTSYASMTVAQLKEALKDKGLSVEGKKADLVARLTDAGADADADAAPAAEAAEAPQQPEPEAEEPKQEEAPAAAVEEPAVEEPKPAPAKKVLTPEERKQLAVDILTKKLKRAEKFGDEALATAAKKDLARVEKFGVDEGTALAKEVGLVNRDVNRELGDRKSAKKSKNKVGKK